MPEAVLFDIDGTLVDSNEFHVLAWEEALSDAGHPIPRERIQSQIGKGADMLLPTLIPGVAEGARKSIADRHDDIFRTRYMPDVRPFPAARELIARLSRDGARIVLASSSGEAEVQHYVQLLGVAQFLNGTTSGDDVERSKPAQDIFATALAKAEASASDTIAVGDTPYDAISAGKSGITTLAVRSGGFPDEALRSAGAAAIYDDVEDLLQHIDEPPISQR